MIRWIRHRTIYSSARAFINFVLFFHLLFKSPQPLLLWIQEIHGLNKRILAGWKDIHGLITDCTLILLVIHLAVFLVWVNLASQFPLLAVDALLGLVWRPLRWGKGAVSWGLSGCGSTSHMIESWLGTSLTWREGLRHRLRSRNHYLIEVRPIVPTDLVVLKWVLEWIACCA